MSDAIHLREFEQRLDLCFSAIDLRFEQIERQIDRTVARIVVAIGVLFGALHYWPPH